MNDANFYQDLLSNPSVVAGLSIKEMQMLVDDMEQAVPRDELPECYTWLVARLLLVREFCGDHRS
jgi:hypothetical protein